MFHLEAVTELRSDENGRTFRIKSFGGRKFPDNLCALFLVRINLSLFWERQIDERGLSRIIRFTLQMERSNMCGKEINLY